MDMRKHLVQFVKDVVDEGVLRKVVEEVKAANEDIDKQKERDSHVGADLTDTDNQLDTGVWEPADEHPNIVHGGW
jgi:hypothetical protein